MFRIEDMARLWVCLVVSTGWHLLLVPQHVKEDEDGTRKHSLNWFICSTSSFFFPFFHFFPSIIHIFLYCFLMILWMKFVLWYWSRDWETLQIFLLLSQECQRTVIDRINRLNSATIQLSQIVTFLSCLLRNNGDSRNPERKREDKKWIKHCYTWFLQWISPSHFFSWYIISSCSECPQAF